MAIEQLLNYFVADTTLYDNNGNKIHQEYDTDGNGEIDSIWDYTYDENGNKTSYTNTDLSGNVISNGNYTYDENGNRVSFEKDKDGDGKIDYATYKSYDKDGNLISISTDKDGDGEIDACCEYDSNGKTNSSKENSSFFKSLYSLFITIIGLFN